jgi:hypothetical protein
MDKVTDSNATSQPQRRDGRPARPASPNHSEAVAFYRENLELRADITEEEWRAYGESLFPGSPGYATWAMARRDRARETERAPR